MMIPVTIFAFSWMLWFFFIDWFYTAAIFVVWFAWKTLYNEHDRKQHEQWEIERKEDEAREEAAYGIDRFGRKL